MYAMGFLSINWKLFLHVVAGYNYMHLIFVRGYHLVVEFWSSSPLNPEGRDCLLIKLNNRLLIFTLNFINLYTFASCMENQ